jgi:hypothetical protein
MTFHFHSFIFSHHGKELSSNPTRLSKEIIAKFGGA